MSGAAQLAWKRFVIGAFAAASAFISLNLLPHVFTRHEPEHCGLQVMGFPFTFRSFGGYAGNVYFDSSKFFTDLFVGLVASVALGYCVARFLQPDEPHSA